jgi:hypothetical protein
MGLATSMKRTWLTGFYVIVCLRRFLREDRFVGVRLLFGLWSIV